MNRHSGLEQAALGLALCALAGTGPGCVRSDSRDAAEPEHVTAQLSLTFTRVGGEDQARFDAVGHFIRFAASDADHVPAILGLPDDDAVPLDGCRMIDSAAALDHALVAARSALPVKLLDAGRLQVKGPADATVLAPHHYPELTPYLAGIMYGNEDELPLALQAGGIYEVAGDGGEDIGPFQAQVVAPRAFPTLETPAYRRNGDLDVRWSPAADAAAPLMLTVSWSARGASREVRCRVRDTGSFTIGRELIASMPPANQLLTAEVAALRTRTAPVAAPGAGRGDLRLGLRHVVPLPAAPSLAPPVAPLQAPPQVAPPAAPQGALPVVVDER